MNPPNPPPPFLSTRPNLSRRKFIRGGGILLSLPLLDAMTPAFAALRKSSATTTPGGKPRRLFGICNNLGLLPEHFFPKNAGRDYQLSPYLEGLKDLRDDVTVFSGVYHPDVDGGHPADNCFLTAAPHPGSGGLRQTPPPAPYTAARTRHHTRFPPKTLGADVQRGGRRLAWGPCGGLTPRAGSAAGGLCRPVIREA